MNIQRKVENMRNVYGRHWVLPTLHDTYIFLVSEIGEIGDALIRTHPLREGYFRARPGVHPDLTEEIGDALVMLCTLASQLGIDIDIAVERSLNKIRSMAS